MYPCIPERLFQGLFEQFLSKHDLTVTLYQPVICSKCNYSQTRDEVIKRIREKNGYIFCSHCGKKNSLPEGKPLVLSEKDRQLVNQNSRVAECRTNLEKALIHIKSFVERQNRQIPTCFISYAWGDPTYEKWVEKQLTFRSFFSTTLDFLCHCTEFCT